MQKTLQLILCLIFFINSISSYIFRVHLVCYDGHGTDHKKWKEVVCNFGTCVKIKNPLDEQQYCLQGTHPLDGTCTNDYPNEMSVSITKRGILKD